ncbi:MAG TPA: hypothetical protein VHN11_18790 [Xanthobacteraceae bacterium]|jgi:hypothetical protein|nr:hypothetical protein [Xanthobacteraceae bacterium]
MVRKGILLISAAFAFGLLLGGATFFFRNQIIEPADRTHAETHPAWTEVKWPFLMDQWGKGAAFHCHADTCGREVNVYLRAKIGFCNCTTGVSDDEELDRVGDVSLLDDKYAPLAEGHPVRIGKMQGRSRPYLVPRVSAGASTSVLAIAFNDRCDVVVATAVVDREPAAIEPAVLAFLNGEVVSHWVKLALGL